MGSAWGTVVGTGWASGVSLYGVVLLLGLFGRWGLGEIPEVFTRSEVIVGAAALYGVEFFADKIPYVDNVWDAVHTIVRPLGAATIGALLTGDADTPVQALASASSGGLALAAHTAKATVRGAINTSPEPASNVVTSLAEDGLTLAVVYFAVTNPVLAAVVVAVLVVAGAVLTVVVWKAARRGLRRLRDRSWTVGNVRRR